MRKSSLLSANHADESFVREPATWLSYGALGSYAYWLYAFGPALAILHDELKFPYTMVGIYSGVWAIGSILAGLSFAPISIRIGRRLLMWFAALAITIGAALFITTRTVSWTLVGAGTLGLAGTMLQIMTQAILSDQHGPRRGQALVEANIGAGVCAVFAPVALGAFQETPLTWRAGMILPALSLGVLYLVYGRQPLHSPVPRRDITRTPRLPFAFWILCLLVAAGIGVEFCVAYFGAELLTVTTGLLPTTAATTMVMFYAGILVGRIGGSALAHRPERTTQLVWASLATTLAGISVLWLSHETFIAVTALFLSGLGIANLFPCSLALALAATTRQQSDRANARTQLIGGLVLFSAPLFLGGLADHIGLVTAFSVGPILVLLACLLLFTGIHAAVAPTNK